MDRYKISTDLYTYSDSSTSTGMMSNRLFNPYSTSTGTSNLTIKYTDSSYSIFPKTGMTCNEYFIDEEGFFCVNYDKAKPVLTIKEMENSAMANTLVSAIENELEEYIYDNFDRYELIEYGSYIYSVIQEKAYEFIGKAIDKIKEDYDIEDEDKYADGLFEAIDFDSLYDVVDDVINAPMTTEEKLAEIGMSYRDFL